MGFDIRMETLEVKKRIGVVPEISNLYDELTCTENLIFAEQLYGVPKNQRQRRAQELIQLLRLEGKKDALFSGLSKGIKRSLSIAAALVHSPTLLFLDEPTSGLDVVSARNLRTIIHQLNQQGSTIFLTTHNIEEANLLCHRIAIIVNGRIIANDTPEALKRSIRKEPIVEIRVTDPSSIELVQKIKGFDGVETVNRRQEHFIIRFRESPSWENFFLYLKAQGIIVTSINTFQPTLEDAFVKITGLEREIMMIEKEGKKG
jgi:ABC-2 type transport system ATP-binding protein